MLIPASLLLAGAAMPLPLAAQAMVQPLPGTTDADKLADLVRQIGRNPRDVRALVDAGDLSAKLGDTTAAASLYKRASQVDPNNARVQAGIARILVNGEHPGEALRYFNQAERAGLSPATFAGDRGLAFDLIGEQERAQRDYRVALARPGEDDEDEVRRRYALSLGISGRKDEALQQIDALLRKSDRGAWRARAFILAMNGDASGATSIATTMMPAGMGAGLAAFFTRLPTLSPADRAFAVHFGEVTPTPERIADARLVPPLPALAPDPYARPAGVQVAAQTAATPAPVVRNNRRGRESRERYRTASRSGSTAAGQVAAAAAVPAQTLPQATTPPASSPTQVAQALVPARPSYTTQPAVSQPTPAATQVLAATATGPAAPVTQTSLTARPTGTLQPAAPAATLAAAAETRTIVPTPATTLASAAAQANNAIGSQSAALPRATGALSPVPTANAAAQTPVALAASNPAAPSATPPANEPAPAQPTQLAAAASSAPVFTPPPRDTAAQRVDNGDTILARIVANISIPASELGVAPMPGAAPQPGSPTSIDEAALTAERNAAAIERRREREATAAAESRTRAAAPTKAATAQTDTAAGPKDRSDDAASSKSRRTSTRKEQLAQAAAEDTPATKRRGARATDKKTEADEPKLTPRQAAAKAKADAKALADAKAAAAADKKAAAAEKKAARTEPERYWVQVAGGATQNDLAKAWKNVRAKSSLLANRAGYTTPLRATNRVVTGPFKTQDEAQAMVNKLSKDGVSAFSFTSEAGQKMTKLGGK